MASNGRATSEPLTQSNLDRNDDALLDALKHGDERVFTELVERWSGMMLRVARSHLGDHAVAEDVVQDAWLTVLRSLDRFERRSTLSTWVLGIVVNLARSRARAERRTISSPQIRPALG
jgi:RNA polymerase sigma-70 factor (ECF subfamily)